MAETLLYGLNVRTALSVVNSTTVVVASGGRARRLGSAIPKSLLNFGNRNYLQIALESLSALTFARIVIATDRVDHIETYRSIESAANASGRSTVRVDIDGGVASTIELAKDAAIKADGSHILFLYGHAPRPPTDIAALFCHAQPIVVSVCAGSTKRCRIPWAGGRFVEPPYLIERAMLAGTSALTWDAFFGAHCKDMSVSDLCGPGEFNYAADIPQYDHYLGSWSASAIRAPELAAT